MSEWAICVGCKNLIAVDSVCSHCGFDNSRQVTQSAPAPPARKVSPEQRAGRACIRCGAENQPMHPDDGWAGLGPGLFECIDAAACDTRIEADFDAYLEAQEAKSRAEEATANMLWEQERRQAEEETERPLSLDVLLENEEI